jgi:Flp pilus assembly secretin CpaC
MTALQKTFVVVTMFAAVGVVFYEANQVATLRTQVQTLQRQQTSLSEQNRQLLRERFIGERHDDSKSATIAGIMSDPNFKVVMHALENRSGFEQLAEPEAVTISGRGENRMRVSDIVINVIPSATNHTPSTGQH